MARGSVPEEMGSPGPFLFVIDLRGGGVELTAFGGPFSDRGSP